MENSFTPYFLKNSRLAAVVFFLVLIAAIPFKSYCQKKQLAASSKVVKIGYLDHFALRKGYKALNDAKQILIK